MKNPKRLRLACIAMAAVMALSAAPAMTYADIASGSESQISAQADEDESTETSTASDMEQADGDDASNEEQKEASYDSDEKEETDSSSKDSESDTDSVSKAESYAKSEAEDDETKDDSSSEDDKDDKGWDSAVVVAEGDEDTDDSKIIDATKTDSDEIVKKLTETNPTSEFKKDEESGSNPLNLKKNQETIAVVQNELLLFQNLGGQNSSVVFDNYLNQSSPAANSEYEGGLNFENVIKTGNRSYSNNFEKAWDYNANNDIN